MLMCVLPACMSPLGKHLNSFQPSYESRRPLRASRQQEIRLMHDEWLSICKLLSPREKQKSPVTTLAKQARCPSLWTYADGHTVYRELTQSFHLPCVEVRALGKKSGTIRPSAALASVMAGRPPFL
jgi:hypothetical protein